MPGTTKAAGGRQGGSSQPLEGAGLCRHLISDLKPPELGDNTFLLFPAPQFVAICYSSLKEAVQCLSITQAQAVLDLSMNAFKGINLLY